MVVTILTTVAKLGGWLEGNSGGGGSLGGVGGSSDCSWYSIDHYITLCTLWYLQCDHWICDGLH